MKELKEVKIKFIVKVESGNSDDKIGNRLANKIKENSKFPEIESENGYGELECRLNEAIFCSSFFHELFLTKDILVFPAEECTKHSFITRYTMGFNLVSKKMFDLMIYDQEKMANSFRSVVKNLEDKLGFKLESIIFEKRYEVIERDLYKED